MMKDYSIWFQTEFAPKFIGYYNQEERTIDLREYLKKFDQNYQRSLLLAVDNDNIKHSIDRERYKAFPKIEMQFTEEPWYSKETPFNKVKERQICGPSDQKKVYANAFVNILEKVAHDNMKEYCGRKNWPEICATIEEMETKHGALSWSEADGSGFDMTQLYINNELVYQMMMTCAKSYRTHWIEPLNPDWVYDALKVSLVLNVQMDGTNIIYQTEGRASGDGWTTFANTILMISYYQYMMQRARVKDYSLLVKGDDVLIGVKPPDIPGVVREHSNVFTQTKVLQEHGLGQISDPLKFVSIEETSFLSNHFFRLDDNRLRMTRIPARVFQTTSWTTSFSSVAHFTEKRRRELVFSKGKCLESWAGDLPIWGPLAAKMIALGQPGKKLVIDQYVDAPRVWHRKHKTDSTAYLYYLLQRYKLNRQDVRAIEMAISNIHSLDQVLDVEQVLNFY